MYLFFKRGSVKPGDIFSLVGILFLAVTALYIGGNFSSIVTPFGNVLKPEASSLAPTITQTFGDSFNDNNINTDKWNIAKPTNVTIKETAGELRINVPAGPQRDTTDAIEGGLAFKQLMKAKGDFNVRLVLFRPVVTGAGTGRSGIRFTSAGALNNELAVIRWDVNGTNSTVTFRVQGANGAELKSQSAPLVTNVAVFRLMRVNTTYQADYKLGNDVTEDTPWKSLGSVSEVTLGAIGYVRLFTNNSGVQNQFPAVASRFDVVNLGWEGAPSTMTNFWDNFADGKVGTEWLANLTAGATIKETIADNLRVDLAAGSVNGKVRDGAVTRTLPVVNDNKDFLFQASVFKPKVIGAGNGSVRIAFRSNSAEGRNDQEMAAVTWTISGSTAWVTFRVVAPNGTELTSVTNTNITASKLTLRLHRQGQKYSGYYKIGDSDDSPWVTIGQEQSGQLGGDGKLRIIVSNVGANNKFPQVIVNVDSAGGWAGK